MPKILFISKSFGTGGAGIAAKRIRKALISAGADISFLSQEQIQSPEKGVDFTSKGLRKYSHQWKNFILERMYFFPHEKSKSIRFAFSPAIAGENITHFNQIQEADIIHLHWINQGFLSLKSIEKIIKLRKPIVWTLHDQWVFTGGCHVALDCVNYQKSCGNCLYLKKPGEKDLSSKVHRKKLDLLKGANITFICCSNWLKNCAENSTILKGERIYSIPNPIDTNVFNVQNKLQAKKNLNLNPEKKYILFGAANAANVNKGIEYLIKAIKYYASNFEEENTELLIIGKSKLLDLNQFKLKTKLLGELKSQQKMAEAYNAADVFVLPTLMDNLPNMIMESMSCGTVPVSFNVGGVPQLIDHKNNGYIAKYKSYEDLAQGINWALTECGEHEIKDARKKIEESFSEESVARRYIDIYNSLTNNL